MKQAQPANEIKERRAQSRLLAASSDKLRHLLTRQEADRLSQQLLANYQATRQTKSL